MTFADYHDIGMQGLFVYPPNKFAFCLIDKNACSTWISTVMQPLLHGGKAPCKTESKAEDCVSELDFGVSDESRERFGQRGIESIFQDSGATRAVFVRDPMERFASAFFNKCLNAQHLHAVHRYCLYHSSNGSTTRFRDIVETALASDMSTVNSHWMPQAYHCELKERINGYNVIGLMQKETFEEDMNCVLAKSGLQRFIKPNHTQLSPTLMNDRNRLSETMVLQKLFPADIALQLINHMRIDYDVFGFSRNPEWLQGATGEWYDLDPSPVPSLAADISYEQRESDDLVELAISRGYAI